MRLADSSLERAPRKINLGSGTHYAAGWLNLDVRADDHTRADLVVDGADPFGGFPDGWASSVYLGHVLEHVPWPRVVPLLREVRRVLQPAGGVLAVSPDVYRCLNAWKQGDLPWELVTSALEHADANAGDWPEAVHWWNCEERRLVAAFRAAGFARVSVPTPAALAAWPIVGWSAEWQCAVLAAGS